MKTLDYLICIALILGSSFSAYRHGRNAGFKEANVQADKYWMEAILSRHLAYLVKPKNGESYVRFRYVPKVRKVPVIILDENGREVNR